MITAKDRGKLAALEDWLAKSAEQRKATVKSREELIAKDKIRKAVEKVSEMTVAAEQD